MPVCAGSYPKMSEDVRSDMKMPVPAGSSMFLHIRGIPRQFPPFFASMLIQKGRWCGGGIRLLAMQETGGQLLAKKERSCARLSSPIEGVRA